MLQTDQGEFLRVIEGLAAIKPGGNLTPEALDLWWCAMRGWSIEDFRSAASHLARSVEFMPSPFHFEQLRRAGELTAGEAWVKVLSGETLEPDSREWRAARVVGGQRAIRMADIERDLPHIQRRFMDAYEELTDVDATRIALPQFSNDIRQLGVVLKRLA